MGGIRGTERFYLRKRAASEEAEQPETLTGDSYTDLRRQDRTGPRGRKEQMATEQGSKEEERVEASDRQEGVIFMFYNEGIQCQMWRKEKIWEMKQTK